MVSHRSNSVKIFVCIAFSSILPSIALPTIHSIRQIDEHPAYLKVTCSEAVVDRRRPALDRWQAAKADGALSAINRYWNEDTGGAGGQNGQLPLNWLNTMLNHFGMPGANCGLSVDDCNIDRDCADHTMSHPHPPTPGDWLVLTSISNFHAFYVSFYLSIQSARSALVNTMGSFVSTFAQQKEDPMDELFDKILNGFIDMGVNFLLGKAFGGLAEDLTAKGLDGESIADAAQDNLGKAIEYAKKDGTLPEGLSQEDKKATLVETLQAITDRYIKVIDTYITKSLRGEYPYLADFSGTLRTAVWANDSLNQSLPDMSNSLQQVFSASLLSPAWKLADPENLYPVILYQANDGCTNADPTNLMQKGVSSSTNSCLVIGYTFWIVGYTKQICEGFPTANTGAGPCNANVFKKLPGWDQLTEKTGLDKDQVVWSSWQAYQANGNRNGYSISETLAGGASAFRQGPTTPGLFQIPICEAGAARERYMDAPGADLCDYGGW
ncbi:hypothetical protein BU16DRAFT_619782 [Lophium mytilinum]|uniref:Uncharacterized protein n=1 Tax=Lophium mytilinum TaxID=390894 RepID=A0A6A6QRG2_9PEZI|nr:hypothetical protein BU16DRAFT_619782 [Lophium mytilinum]